MEAGRRDFAAYVVSGVMDGDINNPIRWTTPEAKLKFVFIPPGDFQREDLDTRLCGETSLEDTLRSGERNGDGSGALTKEGMNEIALPVPAQVISASGFTIVDMRTSPTRTKILRPGIWVVLVRAGFRYASAAH